VENSAFSHTGKTGVERYYEEALRGRIGYEQVETNVEGRALHTVGRIPATPGADLKLSIDLDLQRAATIAFGDFDGSAVAVDPRTGEILAMVSLPSFDPNLFVNGISHDNYRALMDNPSRPLFNRNVLGGGPPGSTIKPFLALAALDSGMRRPEDKVFSTGEFHIPGQRRGYRDAHGGAGWTDLRKSIAESVNYYYFKLAYEMGIARFDQWMRRYGFGEKTGIDLLGENPGIVPSPEWKAKHSKEPWYVGETVIAGIGQGYWKVTLLQLARGDIDGAAGAIRRARQEASSAPLLAAAVEILRAAGDVVAARAAADDLTVLASSSTSAVLRAMAAHASGAVLLDEGDAGAGLVRLRDAATAWRSLGMPYEGARTSELIAGACASLGDGTAADLELANAGLELGGSVIDERQRVVAAASDHLDHR